MTTKRRVTRLRLPSTCWFGLGREGRRRNDILFTLVFLSRGWINCELATGPFSLSLTCCPDCAHSCKHTHAHTYTLKRTHHKYHTHTHTDLEWVQTLQSQIDRCKEEELTASLTLAAASPHVKQAVLSPSLPMSDSTRRLLPLLRDVNVQELNRREKTVVYMYASEAKYLAYLRQALQVLVRPLDDLAKGVTLTTGGGECVYTCMVHQG